MEHIPVFNQRYLQLLQENQDYNRKVSSKRASYEDKAYKDLQKELLDIELALSSEDIIAHAAYLFPQVQA